MSEQIEALVAPPSPPPAAATAAPSLASPSSFFAGLQKNPLFAGGLGIAGLGVAAAMARRSLLSGMLLAQKHLTVSMEVPSKDRSYQWLLHWISRHTSTGRAGQKLQHVGVETTFTQTPGTGHVQAAFEFVPSTGNHWIWYKKRLIQIRREREKSMIDLQSGSPWETVTLTSLGRDKSIFSSILTEARQMALQKSAGKTLLFTAWGTEWKQFGNGRNKRPLESVLLPPGLGERLYADVVEFTKSQGWYLERGIPYRRGYLLYGPPGCGKSSFIFALAGALNYNLALLNLNDKGLTDDRLNALLAVIPPRTIILLEDVDAAFSKEREQKNQYSVTFSGLLNALDGVASTEERMIFMTTNHLSRLDGALIRPGRVDVKLEVGYATAEQMEKMFLRFFPGKEREAKRFVESVGRAQRERAAEAKKSSSSSSSSGSSSGGGEEVRSELSMAELQGYFLVHKHSMETALEYANTIHDTQKQTAVAASFVSSITNVAAVAPQQQQRTTAAAAAAPSSSGDVARVVAVPDQPVDHAAVKLIQQRIEAEEAAAEAAAAAAAPSAAKIVEATIKR